MSDSNSDGRSLAGAQDGDGDFYTVITGDTQTGGKFRPSDWCDRLYGALSLLDEEDIGDDDLNTLVCLGHYEGKKCVLVNDRLKEVNTLVYDFFLRFSKDNNLMLKRLSEAEWNAMRAGGEDEDNGK